jgi:hypothetical protein
MIVTSLLMASVVAIAGVSGGCSDGNKSDGQITASPEAGNAAQAIAKSYGESMKKKYADQIKKRP